MNTAIRGGSRMMLAVAIIRRSGIVQLAKAPDLSRAISIDGTPATHFLPPFHLMKYVIPLAESPNSFTSEKMDFASLMSAQISRAKSSNPSNNTSKYVKRSQIEAERQAAYEAEQVKIKSKRDERAAKKRKLDDDEAEQNRVREEKKRKLAEESKARREEEEARQERLRRKRLGLPELTDPEQAGKDENTLGEGESDIPEADLVLKLRALNEPAILFAESHKTRLRRYRKLTSHSSTPTTALTSGPIPTTLQPVPESDMQIPTTIPPPNTAEHTFLFRQLSSYFTLLLTEWSHALSSRDESTKSSSTGRQAASNYTQTVTNLTPLFRKFESQDLPDTLLTPICSIVRDTQSRRYVSANDGYLKLSIGKAAWPIGVTMVGIHERSAREKLHESDKQAHIMSDEVTRKYLQAIKRCLSFAQTRWPPEDIGQLMG